MKQFRHILASLFCCLFACGEISAQVQTNAGREFWFTFDHADNPLDSVMLLITGEHACFGYVENPNSNFYESFTVIPDSVTKISIPVSEVGLTDYNGLEGTAMIQQKGIRVHSTEEVWVYLQSYSHRNFDTASYNFMNHWWYYPFINHIGENTYRIPLIPESLYITSLVSDIPYGIGSSSLPLSFLLVAKEPNTVVYYHLHREGSDIQDIYDSLVLNTGDVGVIRALCSHSTDIRAFFSFHTNCKKVMCFLSFPRNNSDTYPEVIPFVQPLAYHWTDFLCKKSSHSTLHNTMYFNPNNTFLGDISDLTLFAHNHILDPAEYGDVTGVTVNQNSPVFFETGDSIVWVANGVDFSGDVPFSSVRSATPRSYLHSTKSGPMYRIGCTKPTTLPNRPYVSSGLIYHSAYGNIHPTNLMTKQWICPSTKHNVVFSNNNEHYFPDSLYSEIQIYTHPEGIGTTYLNGQLIPSSSFELFPNTNGAYYVAQLPYFNEEIPDVVCIENENGFSAYLREFAYNKVDNVYNYFSGDIFDVLYYYASASGCNYLSLPYAHTNLSPNFGLVYRCLGDTLALHVEHNPDSVPVEWIVDGTSHLGDACSFPLAALDTLTVQCVLHYECPDTTTTFVAVVPPPLITVAHDTTVCAGATLSVEQPDVLSYLWSNGATTPSITVDSAGTFQVSVTNIGCRAESDSFHVSLYGQSAVDFGSDSILCELATLLLDAAQPHPAQYFWQDASTNTTYTVYQDGDYWVVITDNCLGASDTINIGYLNDFTVNLGPDTLLCEGKTLTLSAAVPYCDYLWQDGSTQPTYLVRGTGTYSVEVSNRCFSHWDAVNVDYEHCAQELYLPNAFTPGPDALNPVFLPVFSYPDEIEEYRMEIYNRWGTLVFQTEEKTFGWDGSKAMDGVYAVVVHYKSRGEKAKTVKGSVTVVR